MQGNCEQESSQCFHGIKQMAGTLSSCIVLTGIAFQGSADSGARMTLKAIVHTAEEGGFWAEVPALPGCVTQGETLDEIRANLGEAIELWLSVDEPPQPLAAGDRVLELVV
jgi:predicted RNase H-like HicB family nuclease